MTDSTGLRSAAGKAGPWLLVLCVAALYACALHAPFVFDDHHAILENTSIRGAATAWRPPPDTPVAGRPVVNASFAVNWALHDGIDGVRPAGYRLFNIALHAACAVLLFGIVRRTLTAPVFCGRYERTAPGIALACASIWALHPLQTETVTYVTQRTEGMMALCFLGALYAAIRAFHSARPRGWTAGAVLLCGLGMGCKETMVVAPLCILLYDRTFAAGTARDALRRRWPLYAGLAACWVLLAVLHAPAPRSGSAGFGHWVGPAAYALDQAAVLPVYLRQVAWPANLVLDHGYPGAPDPLAVAGGLLIASLLLAGAAILSWRRAPAGFALAWIVLTLAPTTSFVPIATQVAAERRLYLPLAGVVVLLVVLATRLWARAPRTPAVHWMRHAVTATVLCALASATLVRNRHYHDPVTLWTQSVDAHPDNPRARTNLAAALEARGRTNEALVHLERAAELAPESQLIRSNLLLLQARVDVAAPD